MSQKIANYASKAVVATFTFTSAFVLMLQALISMGFVSKAHAYGDCGDPQTDSKNNDTCEARTECTKQYSGKGACNIWKRKEKNGSMKTDCICVDSSSQKSPSKSQLQS